jgi:hypothetical protein
MKTVNQTSSFQQVLQLLLLAAVSSGMMMIRMVQAQEDGVVDCRSVTTCLECLTTDSCGYWQPSAGGICADECMIAGATCLTNTTFADKSINETCATVAAQEADAKLCSAVASCGDCVATTLSDGTSKCLWFIESTKRCASSCGVNGCEENSLFCIDEGGGDANTSKPASSAAVATAAARLASIWMSGVTATWIATTLVW